MTLRGRGAMVLLLPATAVLLVGCSSGSHAGTSLAARTTTNPPAVATTAPAQSTSTAPSPQPDTSAQISAIQSDLSGADSASGQADADMGAATSAQAENDNP